MTIKSARTLIASPPPDVEQRDVLWYENFFLLQRTVLTSGVIEESQVVSNSNVETTVFEQEFQAGEMSVGDVLKIMLVGSYSKASGADRFTLRFYLGATLLHTITNLGGGSATDQGLVALLQATLRTNGSSSTADIAELAVVMDGSKTEVRAKSVPTTAALATLSMRVTIQWGVANAANIFTLTQGMLQHTNSGNE